MKITEADHFFPCGVLVSWGVLQMILPVKMNLTPFLFFFVGVEHSVRLRSIVGRDVSGLNQPDRILDFYDFN